MMKWWLYEENLMICDTIFWPCFLNSIKKSSVPFQVSHPHPSSSWLPILISYKLRQSLQILWPSAIWELQNEQTFRRFCITSIYPETNIVFTVETTNKCEMLTFINYVWHKHSHFVNFISNEQSCSGPQTSLIGRSTGQSECRSRLQKKDIITGMIN